LSVLDEHFTAFWATQAATAYQRKMRRRQGLANYRLTRYADDFVIAVHGSREDAEAPVGLTLSQAKTHITHIDHGFVFLGYRIQRHRKQGTNRRRTRQTAHGPVAPAQPGAAGLDQLLPARREQSHTGLPTQLLMAPGDPLAAP
jgi:hypothetical protein